MSEDNVLLLVNQILRPWETLLDGLFYLGVSYGCLKVLQLAGTVAGGLWTYFLPSSPQDWSTAFGKWAVITGATSQLGMAFARTFAGMGLNVVLISRSYDNLLQVVSDIQSNYNVQAYGIHADFFLGQQVFNEIEEALLTNQLEIGVLVNTNPIKYDHPQYFTQVPSMRLWQIINVNMAATTMMTHIVLPRMLERGKGVVINVSSSLSQAPPTPLLAAYTSSMAYIHTLGTALHEECRRKGIIVQTLQPCNLGSTDHTSLVLPAHEEYVSHALQTVGRSSCTSGYWMHGLLSSVYDTLPQSLWTYLMGQHNRQQRHSALSAALGRHEMQLFARRPRRINVMQSPKGGYKDVWDSTSRGVSPLANSPAHPPLQPLLDQQRSDHHGNQLSYNRSHSRVVVIPSLVRENSQHT